MRQKILKRERLIYELARKNRCYLYVRYKNYLSPQRWEAEAKTLITDLRI